jgi:hypothetical protein
VRYPSADGQLPPYRLEFKAARRGGPQSKALRAFSRKVVSQRIMKSSLRMTVGDKGQHKWVIKN